MRALVGVRAPAVGTVSFVVGPDDALEPAPGGVLVGEHPCQFEHCDGHVISLDHRIIGYNEAGGRGFSASGSFHIGIGIGGSRADGRLHGIRLRPGRLVRTDGPVPILYVLGRHGRSRGVRSVFRRRIAPPRDRLRTGNFHVRNTSSGCESRDGSQP